MNSEQSMIANRPGGWSFRSGSSLLILCGLLGLGSMGAAAQFSSASASLGCAVPSASPAHAASSSPAVDRLGVYSEEVLDPLEDKHDQAPAHPVAFALVGPETVIQVGSGPRPPIQPSFLNSTGARGPPST